MADSKKKLHTLSFELFRVVPKLLLEMASVSRSVRHKCSSMFLATWHESLFSLSGSSASSSASSKVLIVVCCYLHSSSEVSKCWLNIFEIGDKAQKGNRFLCNLALTELTSSHSS